MQRSFPSRPTSARFQEDDPAEFLHNELCSRLVFDRYPGAELTRGAAEATGHHETLGALPAYAAALEARTTRTSRVVMQDGSLGLLPWDLSIVLRHVFQGASPPGLPDLHGEGTEALELSLQA